MLRDREVSAERRLPDTVNVAAVRRKRGLSQQEFALRFGLEVRTVRNWEQGRNRPDLAALMLLHVIERDPAAVETVLSA